MHIKTMWCFYIYLNRNLEGCYTYSAGRGVGARVLSFSAAETLTGTDFVEGNLCQNKNEHALWRSNFLLRIDPAKNLEQVCQDVYV